MNKIWIIKKKESTARNFTVYKSESELLKNLRPSDNVEIFEYNLDIESVTTAKDYLLKRERDKQLRSILNELDDEEILIADFLKNYERLAPEGKKYKNIYGDEKSQKNDWIEQIKKCNTKKDLAKRLVEFKKYFITVSTEVDWYVSILKIHNFRDHIYNHRYWSSKEKKWLIDEIPEDIEKNFKLAKQKIKKR
jgi:hypothetical protein